MKARLRAWWQKIKQYRLLPLGGIVVLLTFTLVVWRFGWDWTGFNGGYSQIMTTRISHGTTTTTEKPPGKTLWDLLQLLIIPLMLAGGGFWLNQLQKSREEKAIAQQAEVERKAAEKRAQTEREIASDNQREAALQDYIDKMAELLLKEHLRESGADAEARKIARVRTLAVLPRLDGKRKRTLLLFLYESNLIARDKPIIELTRNKTNELTRNKTHKLTREFNRDNSMLASIKDKSLIESIELTKDESIIELKGADLSGADLERTNLGKANLREANLSGANLRGANLRGADLEKANLRTAYLRAAYLRAAYLRAAYLQDADLRGADLERANLEKANLRRANLRAAYLRGTNLQDADLREADLREADLERANLYTADLREANLEAVTGITLEELEKKASSLKGATLPDGSKHP